MSNYFLKVDKDYFKLGLNPLEILLLAQIDEFNRTTGDCFMSDKAFADNFGVGESTVKRAIKALEDKGLIKRETKNVKGGKERHIKLTKVNLSLVEDENKDLQGSNRALTKVNLSLDKGQNDTIKDNLKDKEKDNMELEFQPTVENSNSLCGESVAEPIEVERDWFVARFNHTDWVERSRVNGVYYHTPSRKFYKVKKV